MTFDLTAARRGDHWKLATDERRAVGDALANVLRHVNLPERELGIAADVAALGFTMYAIVTPRLELERRYAAGLVAGVGTVPPAPAAAPRSPAIGDSHPTFVEDADALMRQAFPNGFDMSNPEHVAQLNAIAEGVRTADASGGIEVSGDAVDPHRPIVRDVHEGR